MFFGPFAVLGDLYADFYFYLLLLNLISKSEDLFFFSANENHWWQLFTHF